MENKYMEFEFEVKEVLEDGTFTGYASTFGGDPDSHGDIIARGAFAESLSRGGRNGTGIAMLWQHKTDEPIGVYSIVEENNKGLKVIGKLALGVQRADEAHLLLKIGAVKGLSIGFTPQEFGYNKDGSIRTLKKVDLWEISLVTFPANTRATITQVKQAIEEAKDERELEQALCEVGNLSNSASKYLVSLCKDKLFSLSESKEETETELKETEEEINEVVEKIVFEDYFKSISESIQVANEMFSEKESKKVVPFKAWPTAPTSSGWDGSSEIRKADVDKLKIICAWYDADNPDVKSSYKLPHHRANTYATVWRGVTAAMAALLGARGGVNIPSSEKKAVYNHLARHYEQFNREAPEFRGDYSMLELKNIFPELFVLK